MQTSESEIRKLHGRLENTEQRQQHMMSFLAKVVQNPAFLQQVLQTHQPSSITGGTCDWSIVGKLLVGTRDC